MKISIIIGIWDFQQTQMSQIGIVKVEVPKGNGNVTRESINLPKKHNESAERI
jgi:hypothetical protein